MLAADVQLVSANDHVVEPPDLWSRRLPAAMAGLAPRVVEWHGTPHWSIGEITLDARKLGVPADEPAVSDPVARLRAMDVDHVHAAVLMPHVIGFAGERLRGLRDGAAWAAATRAYNDYMLEEFCATDPTRLFAVAILPLHDPAACAHEVQRAAAAGARGVALPSDLRGLGLPSLYTGEWDAVLDAIVDADLPLVIHIGSGPTLPTDDVGSIGTLLTLANLDAPRAAVDIVHSRVLLTRPRLRVVFAEGGAAWLPYLSERLDFFLKRDVWPAQAVPPSEVLARQCYATFIDDGPGVRWRGDIGVGRMLWQADFPHGDGFWPHSRPQLEGRLVDVPGPDAEAMASGNSREVFRLP